MLSILIDPGTTGPMLLSLKTGCAIAPFLAFLGVFLGFILGRFHNRVTSALDFLITLPLVFPPIATGFLLLMLLGRRSAIGQLLEEVFGLQIIFSFWGVALASLVAGLPLIVKPVQAAIQRETGRLIERAYLLGKSPTATFLLVVLPTTKRAIAVGMFLAMARSLGEVGVTMMLGGNIVGKTNTVSLEIYNSVFTGDYDRAFALVIVLGAVSLLLITLTRGCAKE
ncbi:MAG: molybdate ABC transporter permease subunit [Desulfopila sp.]